MHTEHAARCSKIASVRMLPSLAGCASNMPPAPPVIASRPQAPLLPASVWPIDPQSFQP